MEITEWSVPQVLTGNIFIYGSPGGGKSCKMLTLAQGFHSRGWKIWDMFGGKREEGPFWSLPSDDEKLWAQIESETNDFKVPGPKQYKVNLLYPMFSSLLPKQLPEKLPNIQSKVFSIPFRDLRDDMPQLISLVTGLLSTTSTRIFDKVIDKTNKKSTSHDLKLLFDDHMSKAKSDKIYETFFKVAIKNRLISSEKSSSNIDWIEEAKDTETISVLCLDYVPEKFRFFVMAYILKKLFNLVKTNKIPKRNLALFREASLFMKVVDSDKTKEEIASIFRNILTDIARYCRSGLFLILDSQDSSEVKGMIEGCLSENTNIMFFDGKMKNSSIKDLPKKFKVLSYNINKENYELKDAKKKFTGKKNCYDIIFEDSSHILSTKDHRFFIRKNGKIQEVKLENLKEGDKILSL